MRACLFFLFFASRWASAQTNILITNPLAEQVIRGNFDPALYAPLSPTPPPAALSEALSTGISADSLKAYIIRLSQFGTRNSGSDTLSATQGIGAARRWVYQKFKAFGAGTGNRLLPAYFQFDQDICGMGRHRNIIAVLPGSDPQNHGLVLMEGHLDSRCDVLCDVDCPAEGVEDNASGTALVMEAARVLSKYRFPNTIIFMATIAEEQGLLGADAFALFAQQNNLPLRAVLNNDVIGGILCGQTSSPPSCPGLNNVDSTGVRLFSQGSFNSRHKQLARYIKLQYKEQLREKAAVKMNIRIMSPEDRTGRGGDHIPFRERGFTAMRFTSANEHGDASNGPGYTDRQHTSDDVLGIDTDGNGAVDSFFVDFNYLARNTLINVNAAAMIARNVTAPPDFTALRSGSLVKVILNTTPGTDTAFYRIALRSLTTDWDTVFTTTAAEATYPCNATGPLYVSVARMDEEKIESLFSGEKIPQTSATGETAEEDHRQYRLFQNKPNPFDEATWISFWVEELPPSGTPASVRIFDLQGRLIENLPLRLTQGLNEVLYTHGYGVRGAFAYSLYIGEYAVDSRQMIFAN